MIQIAVVSGKGGTGKTTLSASLAVLFEKSDEVLVDCDVDAPNLHLILKPDVEKEFEYFGGKKALIDVETCTGCGVCAEVCRFDAIHEENGVYKVDEYACEGCNACVISCPVNAIELIDEKSGEYYLSRSSMGFPVVHAALKPGSEASGGLVAEVRKLAVEVAKDMNREIIVIDGAPGTGCPATSSIVATSYVIIVTEPTSSGLHDLKRIVKLVRHFRRKFGVVINKYDINPEMTSKIESYCGMEGIELLGRVPFDEDVVRANVYGKTVIEYSNGPASASILEIFKKLSDKLL